VKRPDAHIAVPRSGWWYLLAILALVLVTLVLFGQARAVHVDGGGQSCRFVLGFAALHDAIPDTVGSCVEDEQYNPSNGDGLQTTTNGLLVWRKSDNWTAFTTGTETYISGPLGLQKRSNGERFWWENNPSHLPITPFPQAGDRCHTAGLDLSLLPGGVGLGHAGAVGVLTNTLEVTCTLEGYVGLQLLDTQGEQLPTLVVRGGGYLFRDAGPSVITVPARGSARFELEWLQVPTTATSACPAADSLQVIPPDEFVPLTIPASITACDTGRLNVTAMHNA
jgi:Protein of unknown function (DUF4232)